MPRFAVALAIASCLFAFGARAQERRGAPAFACPTVVAVSHMPWEGPNGPSLTGTERPGWAPTPPPWDGTNGAGLTGAERPRWAPTQPPYDGTNGAGLTSAERPRWAPTQPPHDGTNGPELNPNARWTGAIAPGQAARRSDPVVAAKLTRVRLPR